MSSTDSSAHCDCRRITIRRVYAFAAIGSLASVVLFIVAACRGGDDSWMLAAGLVQGASVIALGVAARLSGWRWWYVTLGLGVLSTAIWALRPLLF